MSSKTRQHLTTSTITLGSLTTGESSLPMVDITELKDLYTENVTAKIWRVANSYLHERVCDLGICAASLVWLITYYG
jgi:hypothetical protein